MRYLQASLVLLCFFFFSQQSAAQQLDRQVIGSAGSSSPISSFTIGEVLVSSNNLEVIIGFQQPEFITKLLTTVKDISRQLQVYPVPTKDKVTIKGMDFDPQSTQVQLFDMEGKQIGIGMELWRNEMELDLTLLPSGNYFLNLINDTNRTQAHYKILKIK